jgi:hypothetical protein
MKMMSWSRYHYRPWSPLRVVRRRHRAARPPKRVSRHHGSLEPLAPGADGGRAGFLEFVARLFRT